MAGNAYVKYYIRTNQEIGKKFLKKIGKNSSIQKSLILLKGESIGFTVKSMEKDFTISNYPLEQTEFLYDSKKGTNLRIYWKRKGSKTD